MPEEDGWGEYSKLVLKELETLAVGIKELTQSVQEVKEEIAEIRAREDRVQELAMWKQRVDDVISPVQLKDVLREVENLKTFKTKAVTVFVVVQFMMGVIVFLERYISS